MEAKRFQNKKGGNSGGVTRSVDALTQRSIGATVVGCKPRKPNNMEWVLDTATDVHACKYATLLVNSRPDKEHIFLDFDGQPRGERVVDKVRLLVTNVTSKQDEELVLHGVVHTPTGPDNLLSSHQLEESGWSMSFTQMNMKRICWLEKDGLKLSMVKTRGRYRLHARPANEQSSVISLTAAATKKAATKKKNAAARWHMRFAHLNYPALCQMAAQETVVGLEELCGAGCPSSELDDNCWTCTASKLKRMSYKLMQTRRATEPFQKLMSDMCSIGDVTYDGYRCFQLVMDEATRWVWGFLMKAKEESRPVVVAHLEWLLAQGKHIEVFGTDQGKELVNKKLKAFIRGKGIEFLWTNAYSPEENGLVEKMNGVLEARIRSLLTTATMPWMLWGEAFMFAVDVSNVSPSRGLGGDTPYTRRFGERPSVDQLKIWGCIVHVFTPKVLRKSKLENPGKLGLFVVFAKHSESVRVLNLKTGKIEEKRSVVFDEGWTVERSYVENLLANTYRKGRFNLPDIIPLVRLPVLAAVTHDELAAVTHEELTGPPAKRRRLSSTASGSGYGVVVEQTPASMGCPVAGPVSEPPVGAASAADPPSLISAPQQEGETSGVAAACR
ncbi:hypothetical protein PR002_g27858 [Phytophthora rubi]|uniref:Integrase catalytic domain-containing protein n=1 Tax=Phytophthora rubi TaxID=129364 RepID=A0A6A3HFX5_9STRA|nr:hypothetical protein PR002_g27858 [Phytophthora rubi]